MRQRVALPRPPQFLESRASSSPAPSSTVFLLSLALYFAVAVALAALCLLPELRERAFSLARGWTEALSYRWRRRRGQAVGWAGAAARTLRENAVDTARRIARERWLWTASAGLVGLCVASGVALGWRNVLFFDDAAQPVDAKVAALLRGEQLVPPPALPPEVFATAEVELVRPLTREGSRDWGALDPDFRHRLLLVFRLMKERHGYEMALLEGYRSPERQARLAALGPAVTRAGAHQSYHQYGLAADNAFYRAGRLVISEKDAWAMEGYRLYGELAESLGLVWGGRWRLRDYGHVEYRKPGFTLPRG